MTTGHSTNVPALLDLSGQRYGNWLVLGRDDSRGYTEYQKNTYWLCRCDCGTHKSLRGHRLRTGESLSCGCRFSGFDLTGQTYGRLTVVNQRVGRSRTRKVFWNCVCVCGRTKAIESLKLRTGETSSCGCLQRERASAANSRHRRSASDEYRIWANMMQRCYNPKTISYENYGGRGIWICQRWRDDVSTFLADVGDRPSVKHSIDRIDNNGGYTCGKCQECAERGSPANCRWATRFEQSCNRRTNRLLTHDGETLSVREWCIRLDMKRSTVEVRLRLGWTVARALTTPLRPQKPRPLRRP